MTEPTPADDLPARGTIAAVDGTDVVLLGDDGVRRRIVAPSLDALGLRVGQRVRVRHDDGIRLEIGGTAWDQPAS